jgi:hypothetical protein
MTGKTALFVWELGESLGHLPTLKAATGLRSRGWRVAFAVREVENVRASRKSGLPDPSSTALAKCRRGATQLRKY